MLRGGVWTFGMGSYAQMKQGARGFLNGALGPRGQQSLWVFWVVHVRREWPNLGALVGARKRATVTLVWSLAQVDGRVLWTFGMES